MPGLRLDVPRCVRVRSDIHMAASMKWATPDIPFLIRLFVVYRVAGGPGVFGCVQVCSGVFRCTNLATTYPTELVGSSKKLLSADWGAPTTVSPRPPGFVCPQTGPVLVTDACRSAHLLAPAPTRLASPPWRMVGAGEGCTARGGARQWWPRRILRLTFSGPAWLS